MSLLRGPLGAGLLGLVLLGLATVEAAAPPSRGPVRLDADRQQQVDLLDEQAAEALAAGRFEVAVAKQRQVVALRARWQGKRHWQTVDEQLLLEKWRRLVRVPVKDRPRVLR